jgi:hypothetical protein
MDSKYVTHSDGEILVITTKDEAAPSASDFSKQVLEGTRNARQELTDLDSSTKPPHVQQISIDVSNSNSLTDLTFRLSREITKNKIVGVISGGTSQTDEPFHCC